MTRSDPGAATGNQTYPLLAMCRCGHVGGVHRLVNGRRRKCSATTTVPCPCTSYTPKEA